eukprot:1179199-Prorocentrum_minimum.AAC.3
MICTDDLAQEEEVTTLWDRLRAAFGLPPAAAAAASGSDKESTPPPLANVTDASNVTSASNALGQPLTNPDWGTEAMHNTTTATGTTTTTGAVTRVAPLAERAALLAGFVELAVFGRVTNQIVTGVRAVVQERLAETFTSGVQNTLSRNIPVRPASDWSVVRIYPPRRGGSGGCP